MALLALLAAVLAIAPVGSSSTTTIDPARAEAESAPRVVLLSGAGPRDAALLARIRRTRAELDVTGFEVLEVTSTADAIPTDAAAIGAWALDTDAPVVAVFDPVRVRAEVWLREGAVYQRIAIVVGDVGSPEADAVFAVRLAEVVRAVLIDVQPPAAPPAVVAPAPTPPPVTPVDRAPAPTRWAVRLGAHGLASSGRIGGMVGPTLGGTVMLGPRRRAGLDLELVATALQGRRSTSAGTAQVGLAAARVHAGIWPWPRARVSPGFAAGVGVLVGWTRGRAAGDWVGRTDVTAVALPSIAADLAIGLTPRLRLRFGARLGVALPAIRVVAPDGVTRAAQPLFDGGLALEVKG